MHLKLKKEGGLDNKQLLTNWGRHEDKSTGKSDIHRDEYHF